MNAIESTGYVYYLRVGKHIKIGYTADVRSRLNGYPPETVLLAVEPGSLNLESQRLLQFAEYLEWGNEWFRPNEELAEHIAATRRTHGIDASMVHSYTRPGARKPVKPTRSVTPDDSWVTIANAAETLHVSTHTVRRWISAGLIEAKRFGPRLIRVDPTSVSAMGRPLTYIYDA